MHLSLPSCALPTASFPFFSMLKGESSGCACCLKPHPPNRRDAPLLSVTERPEIEGKPRHTPQAALSLSFLTVILTRFRWDFLECLYLRNNKHSCYLKLSWVERRGAHDLMGYLGPQGLELRQWKHFRLKGRERTR